MICVALKGTKMNITSTVEYIKLSTLLKLISPRKRLITKKFQYILPIELFFAECFLKNQKNYLLQTSMFLLNEYIKSIDNTIFPFSEVPDEYTICKIIAQHFIDDKEMKLFNFFTYPNFTHMLKGEYTKYLDIYELTYTSLLFLLVFYFQNKYKNIFRLEKHTVKCNMSFINDLKLIISLTTRFRALDAFKNITNTFVVTHHKYYVEKGRLKGATKRNLFEKNLKKLGKEKFFPKKLQKAPVKEKIIYISDKYIVKIDTAKRWYYKYLQQ